MSNFCSKNCMRLRDSSCGKLSFEIRIRGDDLFIIFSLFPYFSFYDYFSAALTSAPISSSLNLNLTSFTLFSFLLVLLFFVLSFP